MGHHRRLAVVVVMGVVVGRRLRWAHAHALPLLVETEAAEGPLDLRSCGVCPESAAVFSLEVLEMGRHFNHNLPAITMEYGGYLDLEPSQLVRQLVVVEHPA